MLRSTMRKLARCLTTTSGRPARAATRRPAPTVEGLEDRLVLSTATLAGSTLTVIASPGSNFGVAPSFAGSGSTINAPRPITFQEAYGNPFQFDVLDSGTLLGQFSRLAVKNVNVTVAGRDAIDVDYSNQQPFFDGTTISIVGSGSNSLNLTNNPPSGVIGGVDDYFAGSGSQPGKLLIGGLQFNFGAAVGSVTDTIKTAVPLVVVSSGNDTAVTLSGQDGVTQQLTGLADGGGGGGTLTFGNKSVVNLQMSGSAGSVTLNATAAAAGEKSFGVDLFGNNADLYVNATPSAVDTTVDATGNKNDVGLRANSGRVYIDGTASTLVFLGSVASKPTTSGIKQDVFVNGVGTLEVFDTGNVTTKEYVTVTESTVSGTGLFGNNSAVLHYSAAKLAIETGQLANTYTVAGSHPGASFGGRQINIDDGSTRAGLNVQVILDAGSALNLGLLNYGGAVNGSLSIETYPGQVSLESPTFGSGTETATFEGGFTSTVSFVGFSSVINTVL